MITQLGIACFCIWLFNIIFVYREILQHTPNWYDEEVDISDIMTNFMMNTSYERLAFIQSLLSINPMMFISGLVLIISGILI